MEDLRTEDLILRGIAVLHEENKALMDTLIRLAPYCHNADEIIENTLKNWDECYNRAMLGEKEDDGSREDDGNTEVSVEE